MLAAAMFMVGTNASAIAGLLPQISERLGTTQEMVSYSITVYSLTVAAAAPLTSTFLARMPRAVLMASGALFFSIGTIVAATSVNVGGFIGGRGIAALGGAALVPTASAVATSLVPPARHGRALAAVSAGFTLSGAIGSPLGTAIGSLTSWRVPLWSLAGIGLAVGTCIALAFGRMPLPAPVPLRYRLAPLRDRQVLATVFTTLFLVTSFNVVFIFCAKLVSGATGGSGTLLAALLMAYGLAGVVGNVMAGPMTDRFGSRYTTVTVLGAVALLLALLPLAVGSFVPCVVAFTLWGIIASGTSVPVQHRLVTIDPKAASVTLSWNSTAMYVGIALSPPLGNLAIALDGPLFTPTAGAFCALLAVTAFVIGLLPRRAKATNETRKPRESAVEIAK